MSGVVPKRVVAEWRNPVTGECVRFDPPRLWTQQTSQGMEFCYEVTIPDELIRQEAGRLIWSVLK